VPYSIDNRQSTIDNVLAMKRFAALLLLGLPALAQTPSSMVITTQWLAARLGQPDIVIVHVAPDRKQYDAAHLPGARFLALQDIVVMRDKLPNELPPVDQLKRAFESVGVGDNTRVVLYSENANLYAARAWWTLDYLGHAASAALLDGSLEKWQDEKRPTMKESPAPARAIFTPRLHPEVLVTMPVAADASWIARNVDPPSVTLIDARPPEQYSGAQPGENISRPGHIPGAMNIYWVDTLESKSDPRLLPIPDLRKLFHAAGVSNRSVVVYCRSGMQSSYVYFVARFLGYEASMYDGSFLEWSNSSANPVEKNSLRH
jgi:thiosulfate/3-mercaptopyruvate sulfurtransferase